MFRISCGKNLIFMFRLAKKQRTETHSLIHAETNTCRGKQYTIFANISEYDPIFVSFSIHNPILAMISIYDQICAMFQYTTLLLGPQTNNPLRVGARHELTLTDPKPVCQVFVGCLLGVC